MTLSASLQSCRGQGCSPLDLPSGRDDMMLRGYPAESRHSRHGRHTRPRGQKVPEREPPGLPLHPKSLPAPEPDPGTSPRSCHRKAVPPSDGHSVFEVPSRRKSRAHSYTKPTGPWVGLAGCDITMYPAERAVSSGKMKKGAITRYGVVGSGWSQPYYSTNVRSCQENALGFFQQRGKNET